MAHFATGHGGPGSLISRPRFSRPTRDQYRAQRDSVWADALNSGLAVMGDAERHPVTIADLAGIFGCHQETIRNGVRSARRDRDRLGR